MKASRREPGYFLFYLLLGMMVLASASRNAASQSIYGSIRGLVMDPSQAIVANAKVTLINEGTAAQRTVLSNNLGEYVFSQVVPGTYAVAVETTGFKKIERKNIVLETQNQLTIDMTLEVGNVAVTDK